MQLDLIQPGAGEHPEATKAAGCDAHWIAHEKGEVRARASLWHRHTPTLPGERVGIIGHYAATDPVAGETLLRRACAELAAAGCTLAVGPMDGDTWHTYRFVTERGDAPPFFLEPWQPPGWAEHWTATGFGTLAEYYSTINDDLANTADDPRQQNALRRVDAAGVRTRTLELGSWDDELRKVCAVASVSFQANFLYTPLPEENFLALYASLRNVVQPELVFIAEDAEGHAVGFALGLPNKLDPTRETFIVKTVAVMPTVAGIGLGRVLVEKLHAAARALGYRRAIHALMHDDNASRHLSARFGSRPLRRYALFSRRLP